MSTGRTARGRHRAQLKQLQRLGSAPLLPARDHGPPVVLRADAIGEDPRSSHWAESFIQANRDVLERLEVKPVVDADASGVSLKLQPGGRLGAVPLRAPSTRKVAAGLVVAPRFGWSRTGRVLADVGFGVEPEVGGAPMVPGSARQVPPWILAGPVVRRVRSILERMTRDFSFVTEDRTRPRGTVDWSHYAAHSLPAGRWHHFRSTFPDLGADEWVLSSLRWTLGRVRADLERLLDQPVARLLLSEIDVLLRATGAGPALRPDPDRLGRRQLDELDADVGGALQAISWIVEERGLGGARALDGLAWSLRADALWEAWLEKFLRDVALRIGARVLGRGETRRPLAWGSSVRTLGALAPDLGLVAGPRTVWVDAKYKLHLQLARQQGWARMGAHARDAHRADVHQALAYANLASTPDVDTVLAYPLPGEVREAHLSIAEVPAGERRVRLVLAGLPFGFERVADREAAVQRWVELFFGS